MAVDYRLRRQWYAKQGRFPPESVKAAKDVLHTYGQRDGESEAAWRARLDQQNAEWMALADRAEAEEDERDGRA